MRPGLCCFANWPERYLENRLVEVLQFRWDDLKQVVDFTKAPLCLIALEY